MKARTRTRIPAAVVLTLLSMTSLTFGQLTGRLELSSPDFDLFTPTDWIDATTFTLKERIPAGISGSIYTSEAADVYIQGVVYLQLSGDREQKLLAKFYTKQSNPIRVTQRMGSDFVYSLAIGALANNPEVEVDYEENTTEVDRLKEQIQKGIAALTGRFTVRIYLRGSWTRDPDEGGPTLGPVYTRTFEVPFSTLDQAKIIVQVEREVSTPNPTIIVILPPERPTLEYELAVYRVQDNPRDAIESGTPVWRERFTLGQTIHTYPTTATPLTVGNSYVIAGKSYVQTSSSLQKQTIDAELVTFRYVDPSTGSGNTGSSANNTTGEDATRPDPLVTVFGSNATGVPQELALQLTQTLRQLETRGWTLTQFRYNNRVITQLELSNLLSQFTNATVSVVE